MAGELKMHLTILVGVSLMQFHAFIRNLETICHTTTTMIYVFGCLVAI